MLLKSLDAETALVGVKWHTIETTHLRGGKVASAIGLEPAAENSNAVFRNGLR
jgi:hypothetical protein